MISIAINILKFLALTLELCGAAFCVRTSDMLGAIYCNPNKRHFRIRP